jgi:hypothetical protein
MYLKWGTVGGRGKGNGEQKGGGGQYTPNQGSEWTGIAPRRKGGIPSKLVVSAGMGAGISKQRGYREDWVMHSDIMLILYISC